MFFTGVLVGKRDESLGRAGMQSSLPAPRWDQQHTEDGIRDQGCQNLPVAGICPGPRGSFSIWGPWDLPGAGMGAGEVAQEQRGQPQAGCPVPGWEVSPGEDTR